MPLQILQSVPSWLSGTDGTDRPIRNGAQAVPGVNPPTLQRGADSPQGESACFLYTVCMHIEWKKVTWYSQAIAIVLFVGVFALGFYLGLSWESLM